MTAPVALHLSPDLPLPMNAVTQKFAILAQSGAGKTYTATKLAEQMVLAGAQIIALDPVGVWWGMRAGADGKSAGLKVVVFGGDHADIPITDKSGAAVAQVLAEQKFPAVLDISQFTTAESIRFVADFAEAFLHAKKKRASAVHLFLEEAQTFCPQNPEPSEGKMLNRVERLLKIGRNFGVGWTLVSQQPQAVHKRCLNQAGCLIALRTLGRHEKKQIAEWVSDKARSESELGLLDNLPSLETGEAFVWSPSWLKVAKKVKIAKKVTFDASATPEVGDASKAAPKVVDIGSIVSQLKTALTDRDESLENNDPVVLRGKILGLEAALKKERARTPPAPATVVHTVPTVPAWLDPRLRNLRLRAHSLTQEVDELLRVLLDPVPAPAEPNKPSPANDGKCPVCGIDWLTFIARGQQHVSGCSRQGEPLLIKPRLGPAPMELGGDVVRYPDGAPVHRAGGATSEALSRSATEYKPLSRGARAILVALASRQAHGPLTRTQVATLADLSPGSGTFGTYLSQLRQLQYVSGHDQGERLALTEYGDRYLREIGEFPTQVRGQLDLLNSWCAKLNGGARTMLKLLVEHTGRGLSRFDLARLAGLAPTSGTFGTYLSQLNSNGLIVKEGSTIRAASIFWETP